MFTPCSAPAPPSCTWHGYFHACLLVYLCLCVVAPLAFSSFVCVCVCVCSPSEVGSREWHECMPLLVLTILQFLLHPQSTLLPVCVLSLSFCVCVCVCGFMTAWGLPAPHINMPTHTFPHPHVFPCLFPLPFFPRGVRWTCAYYNCQIPTTHSQTCITVCVCLCVCVCVCMSHG